MDFNPVQTFCERGDLENIKKLFLEKKLTKKIIFSYDFNYRPFDLAYAKGHLNVCKFLIFNFNITKKDIFAYKDYYLITTLELYNLQHVIFLIEEFGITEEDVEYYLKTVSEKKRKEILECFTPFGSLIKKAY
jgi:hypothetical protein